LAQISEALTDSVKKPFRREKTLLSSIARPFDAINRTHDLDAQAHVRSEVSEALKIAS
jgi:hypothetical protein